MTHPTRRDAESETAAAPETVRAAEAVEAVKETSFITAVIRAMENDRPDAYLSDPYAALLSTPRSRRMADEALAAGGTTGSVIVRARFGDEELRRGIAEGITQVVCLAAGSDTRAWRLGLPPATRFFEIDLPGQLEAKEALLAPVEDRLACHRVSLGADLRDGTWPERLRAAGHDRAARTVWIVEGLLPYVRIEQFTRLVAHVRESSAPGSTLLIDAPHTEFYADPANARFLAFMESRGSAFRLGLDDLGGFLGRHGWQADAYTLRQLSAGACAGFPPPPARLCPPHDHHWVARARLA